MYNIPNFQIFYSGIKNGLIFLKIKSNVFSSKAEIVRFLNDVYKKNVRSIHSQIIKLKKGGNKKIYWVILEEK